MSGFLLSFFMNLIFRYELLVLAVIAFLLHIFVGLPMIFVYVILGLWVLIALLITLGLGVLSKGTPPSHHQKNKNPYSQKTTDFTKKTEDNHVEPNTKP